MFLNTLSSVAPTLAAESEQMKEFFLHPGVMGAGVLALLGYALVFVGLIVLMVVVIAFGKAFSGASAKAAKAAPAPAPVAAPAVAPAPVSAPVAPGSAGQLKLHDVNPKTAAMLMAIVADKTGKPLNELRFISIKEVK